jgi:hypothetical protein
LGLPNLFAGCRLAAPFYQALPYMLNSPKVLALRESLARAAMTLTTSAYSFNDKTLRDEVCAVVDDLKSAGWPPERAIIAIKEIADEAGLTQSRGVLVRGSELNPRDALLAKVVRWTIECYYDTTRVA